MKEKTNVKGITLIALVVTIVVLLILAGVSINLVLGNNGIIAKAKDAKNQTEQAMTNDEALMNGLYDEMEEILNGNNGGGSGTGSLPSTDTTKPYLPTGFSKLEGTDLNTGLVIEDSTGNQYVWVEVPKTEELYKTAGLAITNFTDEEYTKIENDLHTYTSAYRESGYTDTYAPDTNNTGWFADEGEYNTAKKQMLQSVYKNGGFYVGRYETGISYDDINGPRSFGSDNTTLHEANQTPVIKKDAYPYNWIRRTQAKVLAERMENGDRTCSLIFGVQWDLVLKYLETKGTPEPDLNSNSTNLGNYADASFNVTSANAKYAIYNQTSNTLGNWNAVPQSYQKPDSGTEDKVLLTTGANNERNSKMNICDIAGNVFEWTLEKTSDSNHRCDGRGGNYYYGGSYFPASSRGNHSTTVSFGSYGARFSLY